MGAEDLKIFFFTYNDAPHGCTILKKLTESGILVTVVMRWRYRPGSVLLRGLDKIVNGVLLLTLWFWAGAFLKTKAFLTRIAYKLDTGLFGYAPTSEIIRCIYRHGIEVVYVKNHNEPMLLRYLKKRKPDLIVTAGSNILKKDVWGLPPMGCINYHSGYLPEYRGMDCVYWAIKNGDQPGVSVHFIDEHVDTGPILERTRFTYEDCPSLDEAIHKADLIGADLVVKSIENIRKGTVSRITQERHPPMYHHEKSDEERKKVDETIRSRYRNKVKTS